MKYIRFGSRFILILPKIWIIEISLPRRTDTSPTGGVSLYKQS